MKTAEDVLNHFIREDGTTNTEAPLLVCTLKNRRTFEKVNGFIVTSLVEQDDKKIAISRSGVYGEAIYFFPITESDSATLPMGSTGLLRNTTESANDTSSYYFASNDDIVVPGSIHVAIAGTNCTTYEVDCALEMRATMESFAETLRLRAEQRKLPKELADKCRDSIETFMVNEGIADDLDQEQLTTFLNYCASEFQSALDILSKTHQN